MRRALRGTWVLVAMIAGFVLGQHHSGYSDERARSAASGQARRLTATAVNINSERQQLFSIPTARVDKTASRRTLHLLGRVVVKESLVYRVNMGVDGFVKQTYDDAPGSPVKKDQRLAIIYSPEFLPYLVTYLAAVEREPDAILQALKGSRAAGDRLRTLGMSDFQLKEIAQTKQIPNDIYVTSLANGFIVARNISPGLRFEKNTEFYRIADLSHVWILADVFGSEAQYFRPGAMVQITLPDQKGSLAARVSSVLPQVDPSTRTLKLRLEADNQNFALRPDMLVDINFASPRPRVLSVPADAVLDSGLSKRVFVDHGNGFFESREVETGERFGDHVEIVKGLAEGEQVVASGTFLVDSESRLRFDREESGPRGLSAVDQSSPRRGRHLP